MDLRILQYKVYANPLQNQSKSFYLGMDFHPKIRKKEIIIFSIDRWQIVLILQQQQNNNTTCNKIIFSKTTTPINNNKKFKIKKS